MESIFLPHSDREQWNIFVDASPQGALFSKTWYLDALGANYKILVIRDKGAIQGGMALTSDKWGYHINPVLCKYLGVLYRDFQGNPYTIESKRREVVRMLLEELRQLGNFEYTFHPEFRNWLLFEHAGYSQTVRYTYRIDLAEAEGKQHLLDLMSTRLRNKVVKASRESGYHVELTDDISSVLPLIEQTYRKQKIALPFDMDQLVYLLKAVKAQTALKLFVSKNDDGHIGAVLGLFCDHHSAYLILNGVDSEASARGVNEVLIHEGILWAGKTGLKTFDFEGSMISQVESFYRQFGGALTPYHLIWKASRKRLMRRLKQKLSR